MHPLSSVSNSGVFDVNKCAMPDNAYLVVRTYSYILLDVMGRVSKYIRVWYAAGLEEKELQSFRTDCLC